jgi:hypothetical protein
MATCPNCKKEYIPVLEQRPDFTARNTQWKIERNLIQDVWPDKEGFTAEQREQLQTGMCSNHCWDKYLGV